MKNLIVFIFISLLFFQCSASKVNQNSAKGLDINRVEVEPYYGGVEGVKGKTYRVFVDKIEDEVVLNKIYIDNAWLPLKADQTDANLFIASLNQTDTSSKNNYSLELINKENKTADITIVKPNHSNIKEDRVLLEYSRKGKVKTLEITNINNIEPQFYP